MSPSTPALFQPIRIGDLNLSHRVVLAPLTRLRANKAHVHTDLAVQYYAQRASSPGTLLISEAAVVAAKACGFGHAPGIWNNEQIDAWRKVVEAVHARDSYIFLQIAATGRRAQPAELERERLQDAYVAPSAIPETPGGPVPRAMTLAEVKEYIEFFASAASNAVFRAGFDGVEIHSANGALPDQFLQDVSNERTDVYGGSVKNRARFGLEVIKAVVDAVGEEKTAVRISPWNTHAGMGMKDPRPTFTYFVSRLRALYPKLAYLHMVEPRVAALETPNESLPVPSNHSNDFVREIWAPLPLVSSGGYTRESAIEAAETHGYLIAFGRVFISNPDLPKRLMSNFPLTPYERATFYSPEDPHGYTDYPFADGLSEPNRQEKVVKKSGNDAENSVPSE